MRFSRCGFVLGLAALAAALSLARASACTDLNHAPTTRWSLATKNGVSWLVTPCGDRFLSFGVNALDGGYPHREKAGKVYYSWTAFAATQDAWVETTRRRLAEWGFNSAGGWSVPPQELRLPSIVNLELGRNARFHWFDPFAPDTEVRMMALARKLVAPYRNSPYR